MKLRSFVILLVMLLGFPPGAAWGAYTNVFRTATGTGTDTTTTVAVDSTGSTVIFVAAQYWAGTPTITDSKAGNTWTQVGTTASAVGIVNCAIFKSQANPAVGAGHTFTLTCTGAGGAGFCGVSVLGFSGPLNGQDVLLVQTHVADGSTTFTTGPVIPSTDASLILTAITSDQTVTAEDSGFTTSLQNGHGGRNGGISYLIQGTAASLSPKWTLGGNGYFSCVTVCYGGTALPAVPNVTAVLTAQDGSDVIDDYASDTWTLGGNWTSRKLGSIAVATAGNGGGLPLQAQNAFGPYCRLQGIRLGHNPELNNSATGSGGYFTLPASITTVRAVLALAVCNDITTTSYHAAAVGWGDGVGSTSFQMGSDSLTWKLGGGSTESSYENGNAVGGALTRKLGPVVYTLISPSNYRADYIGGNATVQGISNATYGAVVLFNSVPSQARVQGYVTAFYNSLGIPPPALRDKLIVFNGDSRFQAYAAGEVTDASMRVSGQVVRSVGAPYPDFVDDAVFGFTSSQTITVVTNATAPTLTASTRKHKTAVILIGRNDLGQNVAVSTISANIDTIIGQYTAAGCDRIFLCTECDSATGVTTQAAYDTNRLALNVLIRAKASAKVKIIDLETEPHIGAVGSRTNATYFQGDGIHWTQTGVTTVANFITSNATGGLFAPDVKPAGNRIGIDLGIGLSRANTDDVTGRIGFDPFAPLNRRIAMSSAANADVAGRVGFGSKVGETQ